MGLKTDIETAFAGIVRPEFAGIAKTTSYDVSSTLDAQVALRDGPSGTELKSTFS